MAGSGVEFQSIKDLQPLGDGPWSTFEQQLAKKFIAVNHCPTCGLEGRKASIVVGPFSLSGLECTNCDTVHDTGGKVWSAIFNFCLTPFWNGMVRV